MDYYKLKVLNNKKKIIFVFLIIIIITIACYYFFIYNSNDDKVEIIQDSLKTIDDENNLSNDQIYVDIKGYVNKPGVYSFNSFDNARINDLIIKAGGLMNEADTSTINLSKKLDDEMTIIIYSKKEIENYLKTNDELTKKLEMCEYKLRNNACIAVKETKEVDEKININKATLDDLLKLNGIGESKAKAIIEYREKTKFQSIEEIKNVEGIGENIFLAIKDNITV